MTNDSIKETDAIFARAYASAVAKLAGYQLSPGQALFVSPVVQRGIAAGKWIYPEMTNYLIRQFADSLLSTSNPTYTGGSVGSYIRELRSYMENIKTSGDPSQVVQNRMANARDTLRDAQKNVDTKDSEARERWKRVKEDYPGWTFLRWSVMHAAELTAARATLAAAETEFFSASQQYYGAEATTIMAYLKNIRVADEASSQAVPIPGLTMSGMLDDKDLLAAALKKANSGIEMPAEDIKAIAVQIPAFTINGNYSSTLQDWIDQAARDRDRKQKIELNISQGRNSSWEEFGFKKVTGGGGVGFWPFFYVRVNAGGETKTHTLNTDKKEDQIGVELSMLRIQKFDVRPSAVWDVPGVKKLFPRQIPDAPKILTSDTAQVISVLVGYDVALKVTFGASMRQEVSRMYNDVKTGGGELSILGFRVSAGGGGDYEERVETKFEDTKWDETTGTLTLAPTEGQVYPTVLAVIGQPFEEATH